MWNEINWYKTKKNNIKIIKTKINKNHNENKKMK